MEIMLRYQFPAFALIGLIMIISAMCEYDTSLVKALLIPSYTFPSKWNPSNQPKAHYDEAARFLSAKKYVHTLPDYSNRTLTTKDAENMDQNRLDFKPLVAETNTHFMFNYACINLYSVYDEKYKFHSIYYEWSDLHDHELCEKIYDEVVYLQTSWQQFGHHIHDGILSNIFALPADLIKRATIALRFNMDLSKRFIDLLGIEHGPYLEMQPNTSYLCRILHIIEPDERMAGQLYSTKLAVEQIRRNLKLGEIKPSIGIFNNRKKNPRGRHILNFDEIVSRVKQNHPEEQFIIMTPEEMENLTYSVKLFAAAKYFIVTTGSGPINAIFMKPKTGVSILGSNSFDLNVLATCSSLDIWVTYCSNQKLRNFPKTAAEREANIDIERNMKYIERMFYAVKNQKWPELDHSTVKLWDYQKLAKDYHIELSS